MPSSFSVVPRSSGTWNNQQLRVAAGRWTLTSSACFLPSYNTRRTLTFSRFPVSVLMLPRLCRSAEAPRDSTRALCAGRAAVEKEELSAGRAKRHRERVSNTILTDVMFLGGLGLEGEARFCLGDLPECGVGRLSAAKETDVSIWLRNTRQLGRWEQLIHRRCDREQRGR